MISVKGASFGRFGGWRRRYPGGSECRSIFLTVSRAMPNRLAASRWLRPSTWQASRTRRYRSTVYILPPSISKKIEGYRWQSFTPPAAGKSRRFRGLICHRRSQSRDGSGAPSPKNLPDKSWVCAQARPIRKAFRPGYKANQPSIRPTQKASSPCSKPNQLLRLTASALISVVIDRGMDGGEFLQGLDVSEPCHGPFPPSKGLM